MRERPAPCMVPPASSVTHRSAEHCAAEGEEGFVDVVAYVPANPQAAEPVQARTGGIASSSGIGWVTSSRLPPVRVAASGRAVA